MRTRFPFPADLPFPATHFLAASFVPRWLLLAGFVLLFLSLPAHAVTYIEAEEYENTGSIAPFVVKTGEAMIKRPASGDTFVEYPEVAGFEPADPSGDAEPGQLHYTVTLAEAGDLIVYGRAIASDGGSRKVYIKLDGLAGATWEATDLGFANFWSWEPMGFYEDVPAGTYTLKIQRRSDGVALDAIALVSGEHDPDFGDRFDLEPEWQVDPWQKSVTVEAEYGLLVEGSDPFETVDDSAVSNGTYITWPGSGQSETTPSDSDDGQLHFFATLIQSNTLDVWALVNMPSSDDDTLHFKLNDNGWETQSGVTTSGWEWIKLGTYADLSAGLHQFKLLKGEDGVKIDAVRFVIPGAAEVFSDVSVEAEFPDDDSLLSPMVQVPDSSAMGGGYLVAPDGTGNDFSTGDSRVGQAQYDVEIPVSGDVTLWILGDFSTHGNNSFHYKLDGITSWVTKHLGLTSGFEWQEIATFNDLPAGSYNFRLANREDGSKIDQLYFSVTGSAPDAVTAVPPVSGAKYVAPAPLGNDANDGSAAAPWATLKKAAETAVAGDTVYFRGGLYTIDEEVYVQNDGNRNAWITFEAYPGEIPIFDADDWTHLPGGGFMDQGSSLFLLDDRSYIRVKGLHFRNSHGVGIAGANSFRCEFVNCTVENTFSTAIGFGSQFSVPGTKSRHVKVLGCTIIKPNRKEMAVDPERRDERGPHEALDITGAVDFEVAYNTIVDGDKEGIDCKGDNTRGLIHHNTIVRSSSGSIYIDGGSNEDMYDIEIYKNLLFDGRGINVASERGASVYDIRIHHNTLVDNYAGGGIGIGSAASADGPKFDNQIYNNTLVRLYAKGVEFGTSEQSSIRNNLLFYAGNAPSGDAALGNVSEYNWDEASYDNGFVDPLFADLEQFDVRLLAGSPAIDTGSPAAEWTDPDGTRNDPGAAPYHSGDYVDTEIDWAITYEGESVEIDVLANDAASGPVTLTASDGDFGTTSIQNGKVVYTPNADYYGQHDYDVITYTAGNGSVQAVQPVRVHVLPVQTARDGIDGLIGLPLGEALASNRELLSGEWEIQSDDAGFGGTGDEGFVAFDRVAGDATVEAKVLSLDGPATAQAGVMVRETADADAPFVSLGIAPDGSYIWSWRADVGGAVSEDVLDLGHLTGAQKVRIIRSGDTFALEASEDGSVYESIDAIAIGGFADAFNAGLYVSSGTVGSNAIALFDPVAPISGGSAFEELLTEAFDVDPGWTVGKGDWSVSGGLITQDLNKADTIYYLSSADTDTWTDVGVRVDFRSRDDDGIGVMFRVQDDLNYYYVLLSAEDNLAQVVRVVDGIQTALAVAEASYVQDQWHELEVRAVRNGFIVRLDGTDIFGGGAVDWEDTYVAGGVGLISSLNSGADFDEITVEDLTAPVPPEGIAEVGGSFVEGTTSAAVPSGSDRLLVFVAQSEIWGDPSLESVTYGGQPMTKAVGQSEGANNVSIWYLDDAGIAAANDAEFVPVWVGNEKGEGYASFFLTGVDQTNPLGDTGGVGDPYPTADVDVSTPDLSAAAGDYSVMGVVRGGSDGDFTYSGGYLEKLSYSILSGDASVATQAIPAGGTLTPTVRHSQGNFRIAVAACVFKGAE